MTRVVLVLCLTVLSTGATINAQPSRENAGSRLLRPDAATEVVLTQVAVATRARGFTHLEITVTPDANPFHYYVIADIRRGSYRAFRVGDDPFDNPNVRQYLLERRQELERAGLWKRFEALMHGDARSGQRGITDELNEFVTTQEPPPVCTQCTSTCNGSGFSRAITWEPAGYQLTNTDLTLRWSRDDTPTGCKWNASSQNGCWAANPSPLNTHWFVNHCSRTAVDKAEMWAQGAAIGGFHNYDFANPSLRTDVRNDAIVQFNGGIVSHGFSFYAVGEGHEFLDASVAGAHNNNC